MSLKFLWVSQFNDGTQIRQIDNNGKEHLFKEVLNSQKDLIAFSLIHTDKSLKFTIDLKSGLIFVNTTKAIEPEVELLENKKEVRLIYFRRVTKTFGIQNLKQVNESILYFLGYQYTSKCGKNKKVFLQIDSDGNFIIRS